MNKFVFLIFLYATVIAQNDLKADDLLEIKSNFYQQNNIPSFVVGTIAATIIWAKKRIVRRSRFHDRNNKFFLNLGINL